MTDPPPEATKTRRYTFRAISGFSMGSTSAAILGLRHPEQFDIIAPLGGATDLALFFHILENELLAGFCAPPETAKMCPTTPAGFTYEKMNVGPKSQGGFNRRTMIEALQDLFIAQGNLAIYNPDHAYLPPGVPPTYLDQTRSEQCQSPVRLSGFYDWRYNPDGTLPAISFCDGNGPERGVFSQETDPTWPVEVALAIDLNDNGRRDSGEPVIFQTREPFEDVGGDGLANQDEAGFDENDNPDPRGDDFHRLDNPTGSEGNHRYDSGEPYLDFGLDGVEGTASSAYDWGEGNGRHDINPRLEQALAKYDPASLLGGLSEEQLSRLDFYIDVGVWDHLQFLATCESFAGVLNSRGRSMDIRDGFLSMMRSPGATFFDIEDIAWPQLGRDILVRYGDPDASAAMIEDGDGGHVGTYNQVLWRYWSMVAYLSQRWPNGDYSPIKDTVLVLREETYASSILDEDRRYLIQLPPGYDKTDTRYPVLYVIHGIGMAPDALTASAVFTEDWMRRGILQKFITVYPDGRCQDDCFSGTFFLNQAGRHLTPRLYEDSFFDELVAHIDHAYRTRPAQDLPYSLTGHNVRE